MSKRLCFMPDDDGHWYLIKVSDREEFDRLLDLKDDYVAFIDRFNSCRLSMDVSNYSFMNVESET